VRTGGPWLLREVPWGWRGPPAAKRGKLELPCAAARYGHRLPGMRPAIRVPVVGSLLRCTCPRHSGLTAPQWALRGMLMGSMQEGAGTAARQ